MGGWLLEVGKMVLYMSFPVGMFHYFNQPEYFEKWVTKTRRELYPPESGESRKLIQDCVKKIQSEYDKELHEQLEKSMKK